jgi:ribosomal protein L3 glutamine methyltransferase
MSSYSELKTIRDFLRYSISRFNEAGLYYGHGTDNAWDEANALILHTLHLPYDLNINILDANLISREREKLFELIDQRVEKRIPLAYLTKEARFANLDFYVDERVLIPRSPLAELIENQFQPWYPADQVKHILDLCTGSGCIAIACALFFPEAQIDASDISDQALAVAKINVLRHQVEDQVQLYQSDLFSSLPLKKYDIIISNPPYVSEEEMSDLPAEYFHEPQLGLKAGKQGLDCAIRILKHARSYLHPEGILVVEVGNSEFALAEFFPNIPFTWLEFECGANGVFLITAKQLEQFQEYFEKSPST